MSRISSLALRLIILSSFVLVLAALFRWGRALKPLIPRPATVIAAAVAGRNFRQTARPGDAPLVRDGGCACR